MLEEINNETLLKVGQYFIPSTPVVYKKQCYGRFKEINKITRSLSEPGKHILLFGGRGYGKTSIANIVSANLKKFLIVKINCHRALATFSSIWKDVSKEIQTSIKLQIEEKQLKISYQKYFSELENINHKKEILIQDVINIFKKIDFPFLVILDEADLISKETKNLGMFADLVKALSDQLPMIKLMIIGIAENSHDFIGEHTSLERCLTEVRIDRMNQNELSDLLEGGLGKIGLSITDDAKKNIILFSHGLPYYIHSLGFYAAEDAINLKYSTIVEKNFHTAVKQMIENSYERLNKLFILALGKSKDELYSLILEAAVLHEEKRMQENYFDFRHDPNYLQHDQDISFNNIDISQLLIQKKRLSKVDNKKVSRILNFFSQKRKGNFLQKETLQGNNRYTFTSPLFRAFLHQRMYEQAKLTKSVFFVS